MKIRNSNVLAFVLIALTGCTTLDPRPIAAGDSEAEIIAKMGKPTSRYEDEKGSLLEYNRGPYGQQTKMARFGKDGKFVSVEDVLTRAKFSTIKIGEASKKDVLQTIGTPIEKSTMPRLKLEVWSYAFKDSGVWDMMMHVHLDESGIVRRMEGGPDLRFENPSD